MKKRFLAASMAAAMVVGMVPVAAFAEESELPTITFMVTDFQAGGSLAQENSDKVIAAYEEYTGIHVDWVWKDNGAYAELFATTLMDFDNMPMILTATGQEMSGTVVEAAEEGAFWDLAPFLESGDYPNLASAEPLTMKGLTVGGEVIGIPRLRELGRYGMSYRTDWAEAVGITEAPDTIEEVYDMLYKFTYNDPDGNGQNDTYGMEMTKYTGPFDIIQTWFGCGKNWQEVDGELVPVHMTAEYKEAIDWIKKLYDEGIMRPDWVTVDTSEWSNGCKTGKNGVFIDVMDSGRRIWDYFVNNEVMSVTNPEEYASMTLLGPVNGHTMATSGFNGFYVITKDGAKTEEDVKNCLTFLDKMNDREMLILADYGLEGITYNWDEDGYLVRVEGLDTATTPHVGLNQAVAYVPGYAEGENPLKQTERDAALTECYVERTRPVAVGDPAATYLPLSETYAKYGSELTTILDDARTQYICGTIDEAGLQAAWDDWYERGGADLIAEVNAAYQADHPVADEEVESETAAE